MKNFKPTEKLYISKNVNSKTLEDMAEYLKCKPKEVKHCYETMKLNGEYDKYRVSSYATVKEEEAKLEEENETNSLLDLNKFLFAQLKAINNKNLTEEEFKQEVERSKVTVNVSQTIINNAKILLDADKHFQNQNKEITETSKILGVEDK